MSSSENWFWGVLAGLLAIAGTSGEALARNKDVDFKDVISSPYFLIYAAINFVLGLGCYFVLPRLKMLVANPEYLSGGWGTLVAGASYQVLIRSSLIDVNYTRKDKPSEIVGVGGDAAYRFLSDYLLTKHRNHVSDRLRGDFHDSFKPDASDSEWAPFICLHALNEVLTTLPGEDRSKAENDRDNAITENSPGNNQASSLYVVIREYTSSKDEAAKQVAISRQTLRRNRHELDYCVKILHWLPAPKKVETDH